jgi:hypothetical protein
MTDPGLPSLGRPRWHRSGLTGWGLVGAAVVLWDVTAPEGELLTDRFRAGCRHPGRLVLVGAGWAVLTAHLFGVLPERWDPIRVPRPARRTRREGSRG